jgi:hypothetical protein
LHDVKSKYENACVLGLLAKSDTADRLSWDVVAAPGLGEAEQNAENIKTFHDQTLVRLDRRLAGFEQNTVQRLHGHVEFNRLFDEIESQVAAVEKIANIHGRFTAQGGRGISCANENHKGADHWLLIFRRGDLLNQLHGLVGVSLLSLLKEVP